MTAFLVLLSLIAYAIAAYFIFTRGDIFKFGGLEIKNNALRAVAGVVSLFVVGLVFAFGGSILHALGTFLLLPVSVLF